jgi:hypothetical protein
MARNRWLGARQAPRGFPLVALCVLSLVGTMVRGQAHAQIIEDRTGQWSAGTGIGFLGNTPDGVEFAFNGHADYFLTHRLSVGPLAQYAGGGDDVIFGLSAQAKYWWDIPDTNHRAKLVFQGGLGFVRAGIKDIDSGIADTHASFLLPIGVGLDYRVTRRLSLTADFLLNFTSLGQTYRTAGREVDLHTNVMPGFYFGVRF